MTLLQVSLIILEAIVFYSVGYFVGCQKMARTCAEFFAGYLAYKKKKDSE